MTDEIKLQPPQRSTVVESIIDQLVDRIKNGTLKPGDRLPSERQLIDMLEVSRSSVREALQGLAVMGLVTTQHGKGTFVKETSVNNDIYTPIEIHPRMLQKELRIQLNDARLVLETGIIAEACSKITPARASTIMEAVNAYYQYQNNYSPLLKWKIHDHIHLSIAQSTGNRILVQLLQSLLDSVPVSFRDAGVLFGTQDEIRNNFQIDKQIHYELCQAIARGDEPCAREWMKRHSQQEEKIINHYYESQEDQKEG
jgi:GntR family transcriptional regulator, transcriptional repressor for pyruvate dehydrogenase complex